MKFFGTASASSNASKTALKNKKKREAQKAKKAEQHALGDAVDTPAPSNPATRDQKLPATNGVSSLLPADSEIEDPEKLKKFKKIKSVSRLAPFLKCYHLLLANYQFLF